MNAAALRGNRYYLLAEGINTYLSGSSLRSESDPIFSYRLHQIIVPIIFVKYAASTLTESQQHNQNLGVIEEITCEGNGTLFLTSRGKKKDAC